MEGDAHVVIRHTYIVHTSKRLWFANGVAIRTPKFYRTVYSNMPNHYHQQEEWRGKELFTNSSIKSSENQVVDKPRYRSYIPILRRQIHNSFSEDLKSFLYGSSRMTWTGQRLRSVLFVAIPPLPSPVETHVRVNFRTIFRVHPRRAEFQHRPLGQSQWLVSKYLTLR